MRALVEQQPVLIADGHHRYETALAYRAERAQNGAGGAGEDAVMALIVELAEEQLTVQAIHRLLSGLPDRFDLLGALWQPGSTSPRPGRADRTITARMAEADALAIVTPNGDVAGPAPRRERRPRPRTTSTAAGWTWRWPPYRPTT